MFIYKITNSVNGKVYIGMDSGSIESMSRWKYHQKLYHRLQKQGKPINSKLGNAILKYGVDSFSVNVVFETDSINDLVKAETRIIAEYNATVLGYNILPSSQGYILSDIEDLVVREYLRSIRRKGSETTNHKRWTGTSVEDRSKMTSHLHTDEVDQKKSKSLKRYWSERTSDHEDQLRGLKTQWQGLSAEEITRRTSRANGLFSPKSYIVTDPSGTIYHTQDINGFCKVHNLTPSGMRAVARGVWPKHKGWTCKVKDNE